MRLVTGLLSVTLAFVLGVLGANNCPYIQKYFGIPCTCCKNKCPYPGSKCCNCTKCDCGVTGKCDCGEECDCTKCDCGKTGKCTCGKDCCKDCSKDKCPNCKK